MRSPHLLLSLFVHTAAIGAAVVAGGMVRQPAPRQAPHVELQHMEAAAPAAQDPPLPALELVAEPEPLQDAPLPPAPVVEPETLTPAAAEGHELVPTAAITEVVVPWRERWARPAPPVAAAPEPTPPKAAVATAEAAATPTATPSARVEAEPFADNLPPEYPANERALGREGDVLVRVQLDARGVVLAVELAQPSPFPGLNRAALRAVRGWRFAPASENGHPVASELEVPIEFRLIAH
ncbi:MAG: energy transducer TonB [Planctomycetes bacterium]|nr:energy transducer TonB [Planctomycetota bacterium]